MVHLIRVQLGLGGKGAVLGIVDTWKAVVGGKMGHRALLVGVLPRVCFHTSCVPEYSLLDSNFWTGLSIQGSSFNTEERAMLL